MRAANSDRPEFGFAVVEDGEVLSLSFDLDQIAAFRSKFGDEAFVAVATRYVEETAEVMSAHDDLWLWRDAVKKNSCSCRAAISLKYGFRRLGDTTSNVVRGAGSGRSAIEANQEIVAMRQPTLVQGVHNPTLQVIQG